MIPVPGSIYDVAPAENGALAKFFHQLQALLLVKRRTRHQEVVADELLADHVERLIENDQHNKAARAWLSYALSQPDLKAVSLNLNKDCIIFVKFYWLLYNSKPDWDFTSAFKYLNGERKKRSDYIIILDKAEDRHLVSDAKRITTDSPYQGQAWLPQEEKRQHTDTETRTLGPCMPSAAAGGLSQPVPGRARKKKFMQVNCAPRPGVRVAVSDALSLTSTPNLSGYTPLKDEQVVASRCQHEEPRKHAPSNHKKTQKAPQATSSRETRVVTAGSEPSTADSALDTHQEFARANCDVLTLGTVSSGKSNHRNKRAREAAQQQQKCGEEDEACAPGRSHMSSPVSLAVQTMVTRTECSSSQRAPTSKIRARKRSRTDVDDRSFQMDISITSPSMAEIRASSANLRGTPTDVAAVRPYGMRIPPKPSVGQRKRPNHESDSPQVTASYTASQDVGPPKKKPKHFPTISSSQLIKLEDQVGHSTLRNWLSDDSHVVDLKELSHDAMYTDAVMRLSADSEPSIGCRQPLPMYPPIWAKSRQEVCETWDWFRSYQGGVYFNQNEAKGYLLSAFSSKRDGWFHDGKLIISHGGGKAESIHHAKGCHETLAASDQNAEDFSVRALLKNFHKDIPVALLIDDKYVHFPFSLDARDVTYAVLGFYKITHVWSELQPANNDRGRVVRYKFAFQWYESQGQPWWLTSKDLPAMDADVPTSVNSVNLPSSAPRRTRKSPVKKEAIEKKLYTPNQFFGSVYRECCDCELMSPQVYEIGWMCLQPQCRRFWVIGANNSVLPERLKYNLGFLKLIPNLTLPDTLHIFPLPPPQISQDTITTTELFAKGWHCTKCGRLSCRYKWQFWECAHCKNSLPVQGAIQHARDLQSIPLSFKSKNSSGDNLIPSDSCVKRTKQKIFRDGDRCGTLETFVFPDNAGFVHRIKGCGVGMNQEANKIFIKYQEQAMDGKLLFRRSPLQAHQCRGELLTHYFSQNSGEPYHYVGGTENTVTWDQAPSAVTEARALMQRRIKLALDDTCESEFNEVLSAAYMQKQKMAFHSDSERGLGPTVAGLSLGSPALMHFRRLRQKYRKDVPENEEKTDKIVFSLVLRHGDILVMQGADIQKYYEHTVLPSNFRIAATARYIAPNSLV
ncbi:uncharacterized protein BT62DRAFT_929814 [Guyanagaster necrorhizus]|uniref:Alpha-ketoglutarate-dependent dioxygenase AlkB-like domain-containing protein n=1 Tax=Guyanagaster necrorhizus TaxID=856835 RepID=A0A9P7VXT9_9AGAR|nr:uncharacterized protein BT62DRAFT_929814 [Guyanagaster necrorhizus MCA 3950]KAG7448720.1 hypothetical protein BT62DRAFT_929814 [Guyanagaster necrorhizus MCA 3950]